MASIRLRAASVDDAAAIAAIYGHYVVATAATFELDPVPAAAMRLRIAGVLERGLPWQVAVADDGAVAGYAYAAPWRDRAAYRHSVESTVYLAHGRTGRGIGRRLYAGLLEALDRLDVHAVIGGIALPNPASVALHEALGFAKVAHFPQVGRKFGAWIDVGYWQRTRPGADRAGLPAQAGAAGLQRPGAAGAMGPCRGS